MAISIEKYAIVRANVMEVGSLARAAFPGTVRGGDYGRFIVAMLHYNDFRELFNTARYVTNVAATNRLDASALDR
jgi:hypothetical protein